MVTGREGPLGQVFRNLIDNARSFSPPERRGARRAWSARRATAVVSRVEDDGPGIPPENLETVFERFYTSRPKGAAFGGNSGLGLSIARQIVEAHGGTIHAENRTDDDGEVTGARFVVALPRARPGSKVRPRSGPKTPMAELIHACAAALRLPDRGWSGVLLTGPSGAGKSDLAAAPHRARLARWWRTTTSMSGPPGAASTPGRRTASPAASRSGGWGSSRFPPCPSAAWMLIARCVEQTPERLPEPAFRRRGGRACAADRPAGPARLCAGAARRGVEDPWSRPSFGLLKPVWPQTRSGRGRSTRGRTVRRGREVS